MPHALIHGTTDPRFARLRDAFASCFADGLEHGGAVAVYADGKPVADLWGGHADAARTTAWQRDTLVNAWSATKGVVALAVAMLVDRGKLSYGAPIVSVWPEFAAGGKAAITLDHVLTHRAGLNGLSVPMDVAGLCAGEPYTAALAAMTPLWEPGSRCAYHALSYGHLAAEPVRRVTGHSIGRFIASEIAGLLDVPFYIGLPASQDRRAAELIAGPGCNDWIAGVLKSPCPHAVRNPTPNATDPNTRAWRAAEIPGGNGHCDARALAAIYGGLASSHSSLLSRAALTEATRERFCGHDDSFDSPVSYAAGFRLADPDYGTNASPRSFGHAGWGGTIAFADPDAGLGFAFVTCRMLGFDTEIDPRRKRLIDAVYDAIR